MLHFKMIVNLLFIVLLCEVNGIVLRDSSPSGESVVAISSSDPNVEKYLKQQYLRSGFKPDDTRAKGTVHRSFSVAAPGKAIAGTSRGFVTASTDPFYPIFPIPILRGYGINDLYLKNWLNSVESFYHPSFAGNAGVNTVTSINDNGHVYGKVGSVPFDNRATKL